MPDSDLNQLIDLVRLAKRYPASDWINLLKVLEDEEARGHIIEAARALSRTSDRLRPSKVAERNRQPVKLANLLEDLRQTDPERAQLLSDFHSALTKRRIFSSASQLRDLAETWGIKSPEATSRDRIITFLVEYLAKHSASEIRSRLAAKPRGRDYGQEYDDWVRIIMGERSNTAEPAADRPDFRRHQARIAKETH